MRRTLGAADSAEVDVTWCDEAYAGEGSWWRVGVAEALRHSLTRSSREESVILSDSCLHHKLLDLPAVTEVFEGAPRRCREWIGLVDGRAQSGGESAARIRLTDAGIPFEPQVEIPGVGFVDGRIGRRTLIEFDGREHHDDEASFETDHERTLVSLVWGRPTVRLTSLQVFTQWDLCLAAVRAALLDD
ncbi:hypothetical protein VD659_01240 [Herbiconiux sp. 11R-BC]|uniref:hypothetical protein n=1 Tax=Herbiconiux sp. 11R-BC TaxID=3111637 RepID=UPI003C0AB44A